MVVYSDELGAVLFAARLRETPEENMGRPASQLSVLEAIYRGTPG